MGITSFTAGMASGAGNGFWGDIETLITLVLKVSADICNLNQPSASREDVVVTIFSPLGFVTSIFAINGTLPEL